MLRQGAGASLVKETSDSPSPGYSQGDQSTMNDSNQNDDNSKQDGLVPEGVSLQVPSRVFNDDELNSQALRRGMESFIERGPLFEGLEPRRGMSKKRRRLSAREKLISGASTMMHVAKEMTDPHGLGSLINQLPCGKRCARKFLGCVEHLESLHEPPRTGCLARIISSTFFNILVVCVILANTAVTIYEADTSIRAHSIDTGIRWLSYAELVFSGFYVVEFLLKLLVPCLVFRKHVSTSLRSIQSQVLTKALATVRQKATLIRFGLNPCITCIFFAASLMCRYVLLVARFTGCSTSGVLNGDGMSLMPCSRPCQLSVQ